MSFQHAGQGRVACIRIRKIRDNLAVTVNRDDMRKWQGPGPQERRQALNHFAQQWFVGVLAAGIDHA